MDEPQPRKRCWGLKAVIALPIWVSVGVRRAATEDFQTCPSTVNRAVPSRVPHPRGPGRLCGQPVPGRLERYREGRQPRVRRPQSVT